MKVYIILGWCLDDLNYKLVAKAKEIAEKVKERILCYDDCDYVEIIRTEMFEEED